MIKQVWTLVMATFVTVLMIYLLKYVFVRRMNVPIISNILAEI